MYVASVETLRATSLQLSHDLPRQCPWHPHHSAGRRLAESPPARLTVMSRHEWMRKSACRRHAMSRMVLLSPTLHAGLLKTAPSGSEDKALNQLHNRLIFLTSNPVEWVSSCYGGRRNELDYGIDKTMINPTIRVLLRLCFPWQRHRKPKILPKMQFHGRNSWGRRSVCPP